MPRSPAHTIVSDRPGLGDGAWVLGPGVQQLELGASLVDSGPDRFGAGSALLRMGLRAAELRLALPSPLISSDFDDVDVADLGVGFKAPISDGDWRWGLLGGVTLPTGSDGASADEVRGNLTLVGETALTRRLGFTVNLGATAGEESDTTLNVIPTLSFPLADTVSGYAGYAGYFNDTQDQHWAEAGIAVNAGTDLQWDLNSAFDMENDQWFVGVGLSWRWP